MRFSTLLFAAAASASNTIVSRQTDTTEQAAIIDGTITNIRGAVANLNSGVLAFAGPGDRDSLQAASDNVLTVIDASAVTVDPLPGNIDLGAAALGFADNVAALGGDVDTAINNAIDKKPLFVSSCVGPLVLQALLDQQGRAASYGALVRSKLDQNDPALLEISDALIAGINEPLARGVAAFSDQTSLPPGCETSTPPETPSPTPTPSDTPTPTPTPSDTPTPTPTPTDGSSSPPTTPSGTPTPSGSNPPSGTPTPSVPSGSTPGVPPTGTPPAPTNNPPPSGTPSPTGTGAPPPGTGAPPPGTGAPPPGTGAPPPGTGAPPPGTGAPPPGTGVPPPGTGVPPPGTGVPPALTGVPNPTVPQPSGTGSPTGPPRPPAFTGAAVVNSANLGPIAAALIAIAAL